MKSVLISIRPDWCEKIINGQKTVEIRKTRPKIATPFKCYIYCTTKELLARSRDTAVIYRGGSLQNRDDQVLCGHVIGEFICDWIKDFGLAYDGKYSGIDNIHGLSCLSFDEMYKYIGEGYGYGWRISDFAIYDKPIDICTFRKWCKENCELCVLDYTRCSNSIPLERPPQSWCYVQERYFI